MSNKTATHKGRTYRLLFVGKTKFGNKAKLGFMDGSKEFWVDSGLVSQSSAPSCSRSSRRVRTCPSCGGNESNQVDCGDCA